jgi:hypothetical protein
MYRSQFPSSLISKHSDYEKIFYIFSAMFTSEEPANSLMWLDNDLRVAALDPFRSIRCDVKSSNRNIRIAFRRKFDIVRRLFSFFVNCS